MASNVNVYDTAPLRRAGALEPSRKMKARGRPQPQRAATRNNNSEETSLIMIVKIEGNNLVITIPMREGDLYPIFVRNLTAFDSIAAVQLDFGLTNDIAKLTIEDMLEYRAVREAARFPALINVRSDMSEADVYTLTTLGIQAVVLPASDSDEKTKKQVQAMRELLERVHHEDKDKTPPVIKA